MCEKKGESKRRRQTDIERGKERGIEGPSELQIERDKDKDERARETERTERENE